MRLSPVLVVLSLFALFAALPATQARPAPACVDVKTNCPGLACVDNDLDGAFEWNECVTTYCTTNGCCGGACPPPAYDASSSAATCTGYLNVAGSKQRTCVDPAQAPACGAWTEGWNMLGYYKSCYGTRALCSPYACPVLA